VLILARYRENRNLKKKWVPMSLSLPPGNRLAPAKLLFFQAVSLSALLQTSLASNRFLAHLPPTASMVRASTRYGWTARPIASLRRSHAHRYTNAAVALERLKQPKRAKLLYKAAMAKFPESDKPLSSYVTLRMIAVVGWLLCGAAHVSQSKSLIVVWLLCGAAYVSQSKSLIVIWLLCGAAYVSQSKSLIVVWLLCGAAYVSQSKSLIAKWLCGAALLWCVQVHKPASDGGRRALCGEEVRCGVQAVQRNSAACPHNLRCW
jgi:hypothetical protein